jgi:hypothetical protein
LSILADANMIPAYGGNPALFGAFYMVRPIADRLPEPDTAPTVGPAQENRMPHRLTVFAVGLIAAGALAAQAQPIGKDLAQTGHAVAQTGRAAGHTVADTGRKAGHATAQTARHVNHGAHQVVHHPHN